MPNIYFGFPDPLWPCYNVFCAVASWVQDTNQGEASLLSKLGPVSVYILHISDTVGRGEEGRMGGGTWPCLALLTLAFVGENRAHFLSHTAQYSSAVWQGYMYRIA